MKRFITIALVPGFFFYVLNGAGWQKIGTFKTLPACQVAEAAFKAEPSTLALEPIPVTILGVETNICYTGN